ncbi:MAG TPA: MJ0042-type zinc finger domain-containing protein, partial [Pseudolabrys sp.]|nr:MJ0042-type zinc finger domain-containing protein [Pseudolabrys sp.]
MQIHCPTCATSYMIEPASLGAAGRTVRCSRCGTTWFAAAVVPPAAV